MGKRIKEQAQRWPASGGLAEAHLAAHLCATQGMRGGWPPWDGCPLAARWRAAGAMLETKMTNTDRDRETEMIDKGTKTERQRQRNIDRETYRQTERQTETQSQTET